MSTRDAPPIVQARVHRRGLGSAACAPGAAQAVQLEGYGPGASVLLVSCASSDPPALRARLRRVLLAHGAHPGAHGSVAYLFNRVAVLTYPPGTQARSLQAAAYRAGAEDVQAYADGSLEVLADPAEFTHVRAVLASQGHLAVSGEITRRCAATVTVSGAEARALLALTRALACEEGVLEISTNAVICGSPPGAAVAG